MGVETQNKILFVCPYFSPAHISSAHRSRHFALHLQKSGWQPIVLTAPVKRYERELEWELFENLPANIQIHHVATIPEFPVRIGDLSVRVLPGMLYKAISLCRNNDIAAVYCTGGPWFSFVLGPVLSKLFAIPYVLDYQDPWVYKPKGWSPPRFPGRAYFLHKLGEWLEPWVLKKASAIIAVAPGTHEILKSNYPWLEEDKLKVIPIGVELSDFTLARKKAGDQLTGTDMSCKKVVYTGAVWYGAWPAFKTFIDSIKKFLDENTEWKDKVHFEFIGTGLHKDKKKNNWLGQYAHACGLDSEVTEVCKSRFYLDAINAMLQADVLLLFGSPERYYMASKLFLYLQTGKPVLAIIHEESPMRPVLEACGHAWLVTYNELDELAGKQEEIVTALIETLSVPDNKKIKKHENVSSYTAEALTGRFVEILDAVVAENNPGSQS